MNRPSSRRRTGYTGLDLLNVGTRVMGVFAEQYLHKLREDTRSGQRRLLRAALGALRHGLLPTGLGAVRTLRREGWPLSWNVQGPQGAGFTGRCSATAWCASCATRDPS